MSDLDPEKVFERPLPNVHSGAEILAHATAWRRDAILKIRTGKGELTETHQADWLPLEQLEAKGWAKLLEEHSNSVNAFIQLLEEKDDYFLEQEYFDPEFGGHFPMSFTLQGILQHDIYHLGQLGLVIKMLRESDT